MTPAELEEIREILAVIAAGGELNEPCPACNPDDLTYKSDLDACETCQARQRAWDAHGRLLALRHPSSALAGALVDAAPPGMTVMLLCLHKRRKAIGYLADGCVHTHNMTLSQKIDDWRPITLQEVPSALFSYISAAFSRAERAANAKALEPNS